jgi:hypothetical protein
LLNTYSKLKITFKMPAKISPCLLCSSLLEAGLEALLIASDLVAVDRVVVDDIVVVVVVVVVIIVIAVVFPNWTVVGFLIRLKVQLQA